VLVVNQTGAAMSAKRATTTIPIVAAAAGALVEMGVVASLARPGGNVTGLTTQGPDLSIKRVELLKELLPQLTRVAAIASPYGDSRLGSLFERQVETAARAVGVQLQLLRVETPAELDGAFQAATRNRAGAVITVTNPFFVNHAARVAELSLKHRLPVAGYYREEVDAGALIWYGVSRIDMWRRAATYVDKILKGAKPADLPSGHLLPRPTRRSFGGSAPADHGSSFGWREAGKILAIAQPRAFPAGLR
jgi:putative ABC transport system substrate-binding protein